MVIFQALTRNIISSILPAIFMLPTVLLADATSTPLKASIETHEQPGFRADCPSKFAACHCQGERALENKMILHGGNAVDGLERNLAHMGAFADTCSGAAEFGRTIRPESRLFMGIYACLERSAGCIGQQHRRQHEDCRQDCRNDVAR